MMHKVLIKIIGVGLLTLCFSCEYEKMEEVDLSSIPDVVSFQDDVIPVFAGSCAISSCHGGTKTPDLTAENAYFDLSSGNFLNVDNPENSELYKKISGNGSMAQYATDLDRAIILKWIQQGAEDN